SRQEFAHPEPGSRSWRVLSSCEGRDVLCPWRKAHPPRYILFGSALERKLVRETAASPRAFGLVVGARDATFQAGRYAQVELSGFDTTLHAPVRGSCWDNCAAR